MSRIEFIFATFLIERIFQINTTNDFWFYVKNDLLTDIRAQRWYNGLPPFGLRGFLNDKMNRMIGYPILRQIRNARFMCKIPDEMKIVMRECSGSHGISIELEDNRDYCAGWTSNDNMTEICNDEEFKYNTGDELETFPIAGDLSTYGAGGYVISLHESRAEIKIKLKDLAEKHWIDKRTRAVFLEFSVYNANINLFCFCRMSFEFFESFIHLKWSFEPVKLLKIGSNVNDIITTVCEVVFVIATVLFTLTELWEMKQEKCAYFSQYWNIAELVILFLSYSNICLYFIRNMLTYNALAEFNRTKGNDYVRIDPAVVVDQYYHIILACIMFVSMLKLIKLLQFNREITVLSRTIELCWGELSYFFILFAVIYFSFCFLFYLLFFNGFEDFSTFLTSVSSTFKMMLGKTKISEMAEYNKFTPVLFFFFTVFNSVMLINIMLAIIIQAFEEVRTDLGESQHIIRYMVRTTKQKILMQPNQVHRISPEFNLMKPNRAFGAGGDEDEKLPSKVKKIPPTQHF